MRTLDPLVKLIVGFIYIGFATLSDQAPELGVLIVLLAAILIGAENMPLRTLTLGVLPFLFFAVTSSWIYAVAPGNVYGWIGWQVALAVGLRTIAVGLVSMLFAYTTEPADLGRALVHRLHLPRRFVYGALAAIQFLPALAEEARMARLIARASIPGGPGSGFRRVWAGINPSLGITLLAGAIRRAGTAALAMELRGLGTATRSSPWRVPQVTTRDVVFTLSAIATLVAIWWIA